MNLNRKHHNYSIDSSTKFKAEKLQVHKTELKIPKNNQVMDSGSVSNHENGISDKEGNAEKKSFISKSATDTEKPTPLTPNEYPTEK